MDVVAKLPKDLVVLRGTKEYDELINSYFSALERDLKPRCFLTPNSASDVATIVKVLKPCADGLKLAICGAGQQATPRVANVHDGITIHLRGLRGIHVDQEKGIVSIAAGERMGDVYERLGALGLGVAGNRHSSGGIGGDALQGGLSYFSYAKGFVCDSVVNYEVVLASGEIVNANAGSHPDLWIALRGGGNNFGIVTRFDLAIFEQAQMWGGKLFYFQPSFSGQIESLVDYLHDPNADLDVHICLSLGYAAALGDILCMNDIFCTRPERPKALEPFADVQPQIDQMRSLRVDNLKAFTDEAFAGAARNRVSKMSTTVKSDIAILEFAVKTYHTAFQNLKGVGNLLFSVTFEPLPVTLMKASVAGGGNSLGLDPSNGPLVVILFYTSWDSADDDEIVFKLNKQALSEIDEEAQRRGVASSFRCLNYSFSHQDPIAGYGPQSQARLQYVSAKYDPDRFFQNHMAGPFKL
ncbi:hypothetical protein LQW54_004708 [Pestalotiopsis sp. IQ-011]